MKNVLKILQEEEATYTEEEAFKEAKRCEQCDGAPCEKGCHAHVPIKKFIRALQQKDVDKAHALIRQENPIPKITGRACDVHHDCVKSCKLKKPVNIGKLERFAAHYGKLQPSEKIKTNKKKIAIIGAGPSGLSCAVDLQKKGYQATIFEATPEKGGHLTTRIAGYRLPKEIIESEISQLGIECVHGTVVGKTVHLNELKKKYDAIYLALGAGTPWLPSLPGIEKGNVFHASDFLTRIHHFQAHTFPESHTPLKLGKNAVILGGTTIAIDTARILKKMGSNATIVFEDDVQNIEAHPEELSKAQKENIQFVLLTQIQKILGEKDITGIECVQMMSQKTESGEHILTPLEGSTFQIHCDQLFLATAQHPTFFSDPEISLRKTRTGKIIVDQHFRTSEKGIFAGGEVRTGKTTLAQTIGDGKTAAEKIDLWLNNKLEDNDDMVF